MPSVLYSSLRKGMVIVEEGKLYYVVSRDLKTPGNLPSKLTLKLKDLKTGLVNEGRRHPEDKVEQAYLETRDMQYLYKDGEEYVFMDKETFTEEIRLRDDMVGDLPLFVKENEDIKVTFYDGTAISVELPQTVVLEVTETDPALKGATAAAQYKPATLETGLKINVPPHIAIGDRVIVDTAESKYMGKSKE
jgi:elongation factor P